MLNTFVLIGSVRGQVRKNRNYAEFRIACARPFPEQGGTHIEDVFTVRAWKGIGDEIRDLMQEGLLVSIKGRLIMEEDHCVLIGEYISIERPS